MICREICRRSVTHQLELRGCKSICTNDILEEDHSCDNTSLCVCLDYWR